MARKKPPVRVMPERSSDNAKRSLTDVLPTREQRDGLGSRARYGAYAKHKLHPTAYGLKPYSGDSEDRTFCDGHAGFTPSDLPRIKHLLRRGICAGLWADHSDDEDPRMLWTIDDNGWVYELRITNASLAEYHGYPVLPSDAFAKKVIERFGAWVSSVDPKVNINDLTIGTAVRAAQGKYR